MTQREIQQQHRKSTSMDDINFNPAAMQNGHNQQQQSQQQLQQQQWKSSSLQRGMQGPSNPDPIYGSLGGGDNNGTLVIRRKNARPLPQPATEDDEDPYGRCLNMKVLSSFTENDGPNGGPNGGCVQGQGQPARIMTGNGRDPRIIDLTHSTPSSTSVSVASTPRQGSPVQQFPLPQHAASQFNTLPAQTAAPGGPAGGPNGVPVAGGPGGGGRLPGHLTAHNTLPARVNGHLPPASAHHRGPMGRHFKPFDHRRLNLMEGIQENPYGMQENTVAGAKAMQQENVYETAQHPYPNGHQQPPPPPPPQSVPVGGAGLIVQKNTHLPHMPAELRHTNYSSSSSNVPPVINGQGRLVNPQVLEHHRDSANFSLTSSDSG